MFVVLHLVGLPRLLFVQSLPSRRSSQHKSGAGGEIKSRRAGNGECVVVGVGGGAGVLHWVGGKTAMHHTGQVI